MTRTLYIYRSKLALVPYSLGESRTLENVPIAISFVYSRISAIIGTAEIKDKFVEGV